MALEVLEPCAVKVASTVLRGSGDGDISALLDQCRDPPLAIRLRSLREGKSARCLVSVFTGNGTRRHTVLPRFPQRTAARAWRRGMAVRQGVESHCQVRGVRCRSLKEGQEYVLDSVNVLLETA